MPIFSLGDQQFDIDRGDIERQALHMEPGPPQPRNFFVAVAGKAVPIKQLLAEVVGLQPDAFSTLDAHKVLTRLGFSVEFRRKIHR